MLSIGEIGFELLYFRIVSILLYEKESITLVPKSNSILSRPAQLPKVVDVGYAIELVGQFW